MKFIKHLFSHDPDLLPKHYEFTQLNFPPPPRVEFKEMHSVLDQVIVFDNNGDIESRDALLNVLKNKVEVYLEKKKAIKTRIKTS